MVALVNEETTITKQIKPNVDFGVEGHQQCPWGNLSEQRSEPTNSTPVGCCGWNRNPGHLKFGAKQVDKEITELIFPALSLHQSDIWSPN